MSRDEELSKYAILIENYREQLNYLDMQYSYIQTAIADCNKAKITLDQMSKIDSNTEILVPIGSGVFVNANIKNTSKVLFDIGAGLTTEKTSEEAIKKIDSRIESLRKTQEKITTMMQQLQEEATEVSNKAQQLLYEEKKE
ncbi:MAG: prefoldin subunit alpha [Candidatus Thermoplasmatota archaeon]|jgi:prefoldin alpha subunit|nr:prefoldin subunit alpha [Candidatus Thermoplasmatota archaeon]